MKTIRMNSLRRQSAFLAHARAACIELALHHPPANEIGTAMLAELETIRSRARRAREAVQRPHHSQRAKRRLLGGRRLARALRGRLSSTPEERVAGVREFLERIHAVLNAIDAAPLTTIAAVHGVTFGGGFELALACDLIIADKMARFCFPELRLGLIPGFGGIPRLKRDLGNAIVRDLLLTGRSINATKALAQSAWSARSPPKAKALRVARATAAQVAKFDRTASAAASDFIKPIPREELRREIDLFCELFARPAVMEGLRKFVESTDAHAVPAREQLCRTRSRTLFERALSKTVRSNTRKRNANENLPLEQTTEEILDLAAQHFKVPREQLSPTTILQEAQDR